ncbi:MAG: extracellular solute-binding protein, partial [Ruthenibacterium sp.]
MMKNTHKLVSALLVFVLILAAFTGCGNVATSQPVTSDPSKVQEIEIFTRFADGASKAFFDDAASSFMAENPNIKITVTSADNQSYKQEINVRLASNDAPDIFYAWSGVYAQNFADGGRALDLTPYITEDTDWSNKIIASQFGPFTFSDKTYGVPIIMDGKTFYYNQEIFDELKLAVPKTWTEFMDVLKALSATEYIPISLGNIEDWATGHYMTTLNQRVVPADVLAQDYALNSDDPFTDPAYVDALNYLNELVPYFTKECNAVTYDTGINDFITGKAAIYYEQFNQVQYIEPATFTWSWFDFPAIDGAAGDQHELTGAPQGLMVSSDTPYPDACVSFLKYLTTPEIAGKMVKETMMISPVNGAITKDTASDNFIKIAETIKGA